MNIIIDPTYKNFEEHIQYTVDVIFKDIIGVSGDISVQINYGNRLTNSDKPNKQIIHIIPSGFFSSEKYLTHGSLPEMPVNWVNTKDMLPLRPNFFEAQIPILYYRGNRSELKAKKERNVITVNSDLIASAFFILTRYEEIIVSERDAYNRFTAKASIAYKENFLHRPIVNEYAELIWDWIMTLEPSAQRSKKKYKLCLSHDVDQIKKYKDLYTDFRISASLLLKHRHPKEAWKHANQMMKTRIGLCKDPYDTFDELMDISEQNRSRSCFYFMAADSDHPDTRYDINNDQVKRIIERILKRGHKIGLHPGLDTYNSIERLSQQKKRMDKVAGFSDYGARQHYLQWDAPLTWRIYEKIGLQYDSSIGFADRPGFRCGTCVPYRVFDAEKGRRLNLTEIPLVAMDNTIIKKSYEDNLSDSQYQNIDIINTNIKKYSGCYTLLWHTGSFDRFGKILLDALIYKTF